jgi:aminomethyltransferase
MAYVSTEALQAQEPLFASVRGRQLPVMYRPSPFIEQRYYRG